MAKKTFVVLSKAWYGKANLGLMKNVVDEVCVSVDPKCSEIIFTWKQLTPQILAIELNSFDDSWKSFTKCPELFELLSKLANKNVSVDTFTKHLLKLGFVDKTKTKQ